MTHTAWYTRCRKAQELWKSRTLQLPEEARRQGLCVIHQNGRRGTAGPFPICLPQTHADHNLLSEIRADAIALFARDGIEWHDFTGRVDGACWPSTHLLDSQVQCVNFFLSLTRRPGALLDFAREAVPDATSVVRLDNDGFVTFEWIGLHDYLGEARGRKRHRGRYATSIDALLVVETPRGRTAILVEWKFTESYAKPFNPISKFGTDRRGIYRGLVETDWSPLDRAAPLDAFFHEPY